ncbi:MAG: nuclear transport factor 2 family protein [Terriglobales bacterium]|jgi:ketosteroid isomerase-like protein
MRAVATLSIAVLLLAALNCSAQTNSANESKILAMENAWAQAEEHADFKALQTLLDDSLVYIRYDGAVWNKAQYLASLKDTTSKEEQGVNESMTARVFGDAAVVTGIYRVKGTEKGKPYQRRERFADTWIYRNGVWVCITSQVTLISH